ncbi:hypothetical protein, partial [Geobacter sp.]|uniref:hypothetical protein n=1 Tax=Geobacter sp. TaxID=46610 RepID=UPI0027B915C4
IRGGGAPGFRINADENDQRLCLMLHTGENFTARGLWPPTFKPFARGSHISYFQHTLQQIQ